MTIEQVWPEWKTEKILGRGSFGTVYKCCKETGNEKEYSAIKVISIPRDDYEATEIGSESMTEEESKNYYKDIADDFLNEIKILESLKGVKNIVNIYDSKVVEKEDGIGWQIFIRMELLTDFNTYSSDKKFTPEDVKKFAIDICNALIVCGEKRIIHRDIKPENIFVDDEGNYKLGDFGVAKQMEKTYASTIRGALNYIAPEVIAAKKYDSRADIYSLGLVMYKLLNNNRLPFLDPNKQIVKHSERQDAYERRMRGEKIPPLQNVDENLNEIILRCCEFKAENRYRTAAELKQALESRNAKDKSIGKFIKKHKLISAVALLLVISIISGSVIVYKIRDNSLDISDKGETDTLQKSEEQVVAPVTEPITEPIKEQKYENESDDELGWVNAYKEYLKKYILGPDYNGRESFSLHYIDSDDIPELVLSHGSSHGSSCSIIGYSKLEDKYYKIIDEIGSSGVLYYKEKSGYVVGTYAGMGVRYTDVEKINDLSVEFLFDSSATYPEWTAGDQKEHYVDFDQEVTREEYEERYNKFVPKSLIQTSIYDSDESDEYVYTPDGFELAKDIKVEIIRPSYLLTNDNIDKYVKELS